jgi:hypothetical protein
VKDKIISGSYAGRSDKYLLQSEKKLHIVDCSTGQKYVKESVFQLKVCNNRQPELTEAIYWYVKGTNLIYYMDLPVRSLNNSVNVEEKSKFGRGTRLGTGTLLTILDGRASAFGDEVGQD